MTLPFTNFTGQFFWDFKRMDNVNYNFRIIETLYVAKKQNNNSPLFNKPIIILLVSIIECVLYDFLQRINQYRNDSFPNINISIVSYFRGLRGSDDLKRVIPQIQNQNLLRIAQGETLYGDLEHLRLLRNRLHIQNRYNLLNRDEDCVYTDAELKRAELVFEKVFEVLCNVYPRWQNQPLSMVDFPRPWQ